MTETTTAYIGEPDVFEVGCSLCEGMGTISHDADCDVCATGSTAHAETCPDCKGLGEIAVIAVASMTKITLHKDNDSARHPSGSYYWRWVSLREVGK